MKIRFFALLALASAPVACDVRNSPHAQDRDAVNIQAFTEPTLAQAKEDIPLIREFDDAFSTTNHALLSGTRGQAIWSAKALVYGRYVVVMRVPIIPALGGGIQQARADAEFSVVEIGEVRPEERRIIYTPNQRRFSLDEWKQLLRAGMDFSVIGYMMVPDQPVDGLEALLYAA